jgi:F-type H+-transporting ATPase subunit b
LELSWSTFVLEIINFLVLVWILKRFLYKPVMDVIARRREGIEKTRAEAAASHNDAEALKKQYEGRLSDWDEERKKARETLSHEIEGERARKLEELESELEKKKEQLRVAEERRQRDELHKVEETAITQAAEFASRLLEKVAGQETEARLVHFLIDELAKLPTERAREIQQNHGAASEDTLVVSAFTLADDDRKALVQALSNLMGEKRPVRFEEDPRLLAGVRITIGAWVLGFNLSDELKGLVQLVNEEPASE